MRWSLLSLLLVSKVASADTVDPNMLLNACMSEKRWEFCRDLHTAKDNGERFGVHLLKDINMLDTATAMGVLYKIGTEKKISLVDRTKSWWIPANERRFEIGKDEVKLVLVWPLPW